MTGASRIDGSAGGTGRAVGVRDHTDTFMHGQTGREWEAGYGAVKQDVDIAAADGDTVKAHQHLAGGRFGHRRIDQFHLA